MLLAYLVEGLTIRPRVNNQKTYAAVLTPFLKVFSSSLTVESLIEGLPDTIQLVADEMENFITSEHVNGTLG